MSGCQLATEEELVRLGVLPDAAECIARIMRWNEIISGINPSAIHERRRCEQEREKVRYELVELPLPDPPFVEPDPIEQAVEYIKNFKFRREPAFRFYGYDHRFMVTETKFPILYCP